MAFVVERFRELNDQLLKMDNFFKPGPVQPLLFSDDATFINKLHERIKAGGQRLPKTYQDGYITPLLNNLEEIIERLTGKYYDEKIQKERYYPDKYAILTLLVNAALQPAESGVAEYIHTLQAIVTDLYDSSLASRRRLGVERDLDQKYPPLVGFIGPFPRTEPQISNLPPLPCMLELEQLRDPYLLGNLADGFTVGAVGLSPGYRSYP